MQKAKILEDLSREISKKKIEMNLIAKKHGIDSKKTIECSQDLDKLVAKYQKLLIK